MLDPEVLAALKSDQTIDITTIGRKSGKPRRIEIWFHRVGDRYYITGTPGRKDWYANMLSDPRFTFHLKGSAQADLPAVARPITDPEEKRRVLLQVETLQTRLNEQTVKERVLGSPLVEVELNQSGGV